MAGLYSTAGHRKPLTTANDILGLPNFAIVRIPEGGDIIKLFSLLVNFSLFSTFCAYCNKKKKQQQQRNKI